MINHYDNETRLTAILRCVVDDTADAAMLLQLGPARTREEIFVSRALGKKPWAAIPPRTTLEMWLAFIAEDEAEPAPSSYTVRSCAESCVITYARRVKGATAIVPIFPPHDPYEIALAKLAGIIPVGYGVQGRPWELLINQLASHGPRENVAVICGSSPRHEDGHITPVQNLHGYDHPWPGGGGVNKLPPTVAEAKSQGGMTCTSDGKGIFTFSGTYDSSYNQTFSDITPGYVVQAGDYLHCLNEKASSSAILILNFTDGTNATATLTPANKIQSLSSHVGKTVRSIRFYSSAQFGGRVSPMIARSDAATTYSPYENLCPISPGLSLIRDDGSRLDVYAGELDQKSGRLISTAAKVDMGTLSYTQLIQTVYRAQISGAKSGFPGALCSAFYMVYPNRNALTGPGQLAPYNVTDPYICALSAYYESAGDFKARVTGVELVYELAEPIAIQLSPAELRRAMGCTKYLGVGAWKLCPGVVTIITAQLTTSEATTHYDLAPSVTEGWTFEISVDGQTATGAAGALNVAAGEHSVTITATPAASAAACYIQPTLYSEVTS